MGKQRFVVKIENTVVFPIITVCRHVHRNNAADCEKSSALHLINGGAGWSESHRFVFVTGE